MTTTNKNPKTTSDTSPSTTQPKDNKQRNKGAKPSGHKSTRDNAPKQAPDTGTGQDTNIITDDIELIEPSNPLPPITLEELPEQLRNGAANAGWKELMPVQAMSIPYFIARRDVMVQSRTGSGKTGAFVLPILDRIKPDQANCQALVLVPTRELARQVAADAQCLAQDSGINIIAVYGGVGYSQQEEAFKKGAHLVVGTPGRILDHLIKENLSLRHLDTLVFDEADRMLSMGFYPDMQKLRTFLPERRPIGAYMFSATFPEHIKRLAREFLHKPGFLSLSSEQVHVSNVEHIYYTVPAMDKDRSLVRIIEMENPMSAIIFCNTRIQVNYMANLLRRFGYDASELSSDLSQNARESIMERIRQGQLRFLVATDVAARGIDIPELTHVFIYEPPEDPESYIHRAGRTGRAGAGGMVITLVAGFEEITLSRLGKQYNIDLQLKPLPTDEDVQEIVSQRAIALLEAELRQKDRVETERMQRFVNLGRTFAEHEGELPIIAMLLDDFYQKTLHQAPARPGTHEGDQKDDTRRGRSGRDQQSSRGYYRPRNSSMDRERGRSRGKRGRSDKGRRSGRR